MMSEENVVPLIVKCDNGTALELRVMWEKGSQHSANSVSKTS
jgi:hypothetical protein